MGYSLWGHKRDIHILATKQPQQQLLTACLNTGSLISMGTLEVPSGNVREIDDTP